MMKKDILLCLISLLFISGCVDKPQTQAEKWGWDEAKYEEYSAYYETLLFSHDQSKVNRSAIHNIITNYSTITKGKTIEEWLIDIPKDKNEFEKTWYMVFYYFQKGQERRYAANSRECSSEEISRQSLGLLKCKEATSRNIQYSQQYYDKAAEYRQKIEEMKPK